MLGIWLGMAQVFISGYQPIAEQTWVQLSQDYYPLQRTPPALFVAWRGNQLPPLAQKKKNGHWQILFPARLVPPFDLFEGEAQLSKAYLARLKRIDEMAYGMAPHLPLDQPAHVASTPHMPGEGSLQPFLVEFSLPLQPAHRGERAMPGEPLGWRILAGQRAPQPRVTTTSQVAELPSLPPSAAERRLCHRVAAGETLWRIVSQLVGQQGADGVDTYGYLLALVEENRASMGKGIKVREGQSLYCPRAELLAGFNAMTPAERQQQFARLEQER